MIEASEAGGEGVDDPVALITGAGAPRVGATVARFLAGAGYRLAIHARRSLDQAQKAVDDYKTRGVEAMAVAADVSSEPSVRQMIDAVRQRFGRIDLLVNCAAIWESKKLEDVTADDVRKHFEINTLGSFLCAQRAGLCMVEQPSGGCIINIGDWAIARPYLNYAAYFPSKGAVPAMTRSLAVELAARNPRVRVNAILPGPAMLPEGLPAEERAAAIAGTLVRREGRPEHIADAVLFLARNDFITGVCLPVDGGRTIASATG